MSLAAAIGGAYGVIGVLFSPGVVLTYIAAAIVSVCMCLCAFGRCGNIFALLRQSALIWGCGALLGGFMTALLSIGKSANTVYVKGGGPLSLVIAISVLLVYITVRIICTVKNRGTVTVKVTLKSREITFRALCDSGNLLRDPIGGSPVIVVSREVTSKLCTKRISDALLNLDTKILRGEGIGVRLIPRRTADGSEIIAGFVPSRTFIVSGNEEKSVDCVIAPISCPADHFAGCSAAIPTALL